MTENVKKHVALWSAVLVSIALVGSAVSMVLWCHAFERLLYAYKLNVGHEAYRIVRAYTPLLFVMLACVTILPQWRVAGLMAVAGLGAAGIALHVGVFIRGASGCCGPPVSTLLVAGGLGYSVVCAGLGMTGVVCSTSGRRAGRVGMWLVWLAVMAGTAGCGRREAARDAPGRVRVESQATRTTDVSGVLTAAAPGRQPADARTMTDKILKGMDDLSASLGLQYARFSYDPSRQLHSYSNELRSISNEEFSDFLNDYQRACMLPSRSNEMSLLRSMIMERLEGSPTPPADMWYRFVETLAATFVLDGHVDVHGLVSCMKEINGMLVRAGGEPCDIIGVVEIFGNAMMTLQQQMITAGKWPDLQADDWFAGYNDLANGNVDAAFRLQLVRAKVSALTQPEKAAAYCRQAFDMAPDDTVKLQFYEEWQLYQGLQRGLRDTQLLDYVTEKKKAFWRQRLEGRTLEELKKELL